MVFLSLAEAKVQKLFCKTSQNPQETPAMKRGSGLQMFFEIVVLKK